MRGGASTGTDTVTSATNLANSEGDPTDDAFASGASAHDGPANGAAGAAPAGSDLSHRQPHPYEALLAGSLEKFECDHQGVGGGAGRFGVRPQTTGGTWNGSRQRRPVSSGPSARPKSLRARGESDGYALIDEGGGGRDDRLKEKGPQQSRPRARPKTAGAGSGGVQGVLARMGGYEEVGAYPCWHGGPAGRLDMTRERHGSRPGVPLHDAVFLVGKVTMKGLRP